MKIDRTRFLLLTATITATTVAGSVLGAAGCATKSTDADAGSSSQDSGSKLDSGDTSDGGTDAGNDAATACLGGQEDNGSGSQCYPSNEGDAGVDGGDAGPVVKCGSECAAYVSTLKSEVVDAINQCINGLASCDADKVPCITAAMARACPDQAAEKQCDDIVALCGDAGANTITKPQCLAVMNATTNVGRELFPECVAEGLCDSCIKDLERLKDPYKQP